MKVEKVLERYQAGERNFRRVNLRGQSFKGKNLSGADFSEADIRGANFTKANLKGASFSCARAGLQRRWAIGLLVISYIFSGAIGYSSTLAGLLAASIAHNASSFFASAAVVTLLSVSFSVLKRERQEGLIASLVVFAVAVAVSITGIASNAGTLTGAVVGAVAGAVVGAGAVAVAGAVTGAVDPNVPSFVPVDKTIAVAVAFTLLYAYIGWRALAGDEKYALVKNIAIAYASTGGTNFKGTDLTDANFTQATLKNTNFKGANLTRTRFYKAKKLNLARVNETILARAISF